MLHRNDLFAPCSPALQRYQSILERGHEPGRGVEAPACFSLIALIGSLAWRISINWPNGEISFEARGFDQRGVGNPIVSEGQCLAATERVNGA